MRIFSNLCFVSRGKKLKAAGCPGCYLVGQREGGGVDEAGLLDFEGK